MSSQCFFCARSLNHTDATAVALPCLHTFCGFCSRQLDSSSTCPCSEPIEYISHSVAISSQISAPLSTTRNVSSSSVLSPSHTLSSITSSQSPDSSSEEPPKKRPRLTDASKPPQQPPSSGPPRPPPPFSLMKIPDGSGPLWANEGFLGLDLAKLIEPNIKWVLISNYHVHLSLLLSLSSAVVPLPFERSPLSPRSSD